MKFSFKLIAVLVITSLLGTFTFQVYWLAKLYGSMKAELEQSIMDAMRNSDFNELLLRIERIKLEGKEHGNVEVFVTKKDSAVHTATNVVISALPDSGKVKEEPHSALAVSGGLAFVLKKQHDMTELASFFQRGLHSGIDMLRDPNLHVYDSLLTLRLQEKGIEHPHRLEYLHTGSTLDSSHVYTDTLAVAGTVGYIPGKKARQYVYAFDMYTHHLYRLTMEPVDLLVWKQMSGILATSLTILVILISSFWLLIRTILQQQTLEELKSDFTNNITHELKTPIAVAYAANDALLNYSSAEDEVRRKKYLSICQEQLLRLSGLVEQILAMSMERRKSFKLHRELLGLQDVLPSLIEQHKLKADKPVQIIMDIHPKELTVMADRTHFINILSNLLDNAIKYSPGKAVVHIDCRCTAEGKTEVSVTDQGMGIPTDKQHLIFDKFYRVPSGNVHDTKGYGLGLFYVKTMIEKHGGRVEVWSEAGKGSRFTIQL